MKKKKKRVRTKEDSLEGKESRGGKRGNGNGSRTKGREGKC